jgi:hypothetical protein
LSVPDGNSDYQSRFDRMEKMVADLLAAARTNLDKHERIWQGIDKLREAQLDTNASVLSLTGAIRDLIDRIPPENLR